MTRVSRSRSLTRTFTGSRQVTKFGKPDGSPSVQTLNGNCTCSDYHGRPITETSFDSVQMPQVMRLNGIAEFGYYWSSVGYGFSYDDFPVAVFQPPTISRALMTATSGWELDVVARSNPSRPILCPPTLIQDLINIPKMLRNLGSLMKHPQGVMTPKGVSNAYLETLFGWMPFVDDIRQLLDLQSSVIKRTQELNRLYSGEGLRRRLTLGESHQVEPTKYTISYGTSQVTVPISVQVDKHMWATIRWKPTTPPPYHPDDRRWNDLSRRLVLGMTSEGLAKGLWDVIPWTWLLGWFTNIGKYTLAYSNTVPAQHGKICLMRDVSVTAVPGVTTPSNMHRCTIVCSGQSLYTRRSRTVSSSVTPGFHMPFMDMSRLSILGALTIQRVLR